jgi:hypothetical protein
MSKLIYILSTGHSGSTILDIMLGTFPQVFSTGELKYFTWQIQRTQSGIGSVERQDVCTCGSRFQECSFWTKVIDKINKDEKINIYQNPLHFRTSPLGKWDYYKKVDLYRRLINKLISIEINHLNINLFSDLFSKTYIEEVKNVWKLVDTIGKVANSECIVDSSKSLLRYYLLRSYRPKDIFLIINTRSFYGYVNSTLSKGGRLSQSLYEKELFHKNIKNLNNTNSLPSLYTYYDNFAKEPKQLLKKVSKWLDLRQIPHQLSNINTKNYHMVAGNPVRYNGEIKIRYDNRWKKNLDSETIQIIESFVRKHNLPDNIIKENI